MTMNNILIIKKEIKEDLLSTSHLIKKYVNEVKKKTKLKPLIEDIGGNSSSGRKIIIWHLHEGDKVSQISE